MYILFFIFWIFVTITIYNSFVVGQNKSIDLYKFSNSKSNILYRLSYGIPFKWFVEDDDNLTLKGKTVLKDLQLTGYLKYFTVRSYMTLKVIIFMAALFCAIVNIFIANNADIFAKIFFGIGTNENTASTDKSLLIVCIWLMASLIPNIIIKTKVKKQLLINNKDIPMLQMFIILMLRSNKTVQEIMFSLSKINTNNRAVFEQGYRIYLRDKQEGINYIKSKFTNERFVETFGLLDDIGEYAREDCVRILESNLKSIIDHTNLVRRKNDLSRLVYSQGSMIIPFLALILLGVVPVIVSSIGMFTNTIM